MILDGYIRVSRVAGRTGDSFISPQVQRDQIQAWATLRNASIAQWHTDLDQSGTRADRPALTNALQRVETGDVDGLAVTKIDRLGRSLHVCLDAIKRIDDAGGMFVAVTDGLDPSTPIGKAMQRISMIFAEMHVDQVRENWRIARQRAVARGIHVASATPTGYLRQPDGTLVPHPQDAHVIQRIFELRAGGASWKELAEHLADHQVQGPHGALNARTRAVTHIIANRVYLGEARSGEFVNPDAHPAIVDRQTWEAAQAARGITPSTGDPSLLAGVLRCAGCRHQMKPDKMTLRDGTRARTYRCRANHAAGRCENRASVIGRQIEPFVEQALFAHLTNLELRGETDDRDLRDADRDLADAEGELAAYRDDDRIIGILGADRFVEGLNTRVARVDAAQQAVTSLRAKRSPAGLDVATIRDAWGNLSVMEKRKVLSASIDAVFLRSGRGVPIEQRAFICWHGEGPDDLPRRGLKRVAIRPFVWPEDPPVQIRAPGTHDLQERSLRAAPGGRGER